MLLIVHQYTGIAKRFCTFPRYFKIFLHREIGSVRALSKIKEGIGMCILHQKPIYSSILIYSVLATDVRFNSRFETSNMQNTYSTMC